MEFDGTLTICDRCGGVCFRKTDGDHLHSSVILANWSRRNDETGKTYDLCPDCTIEMNNIETLFLNGRGHPGFESLPVLNIGHGLAESIEDIVNTKVVKEESK